MTLWDVIEHTLNPREMLEHCRRLLKPGGVLIVNYPGHRELHRARAGPPMAVSDVRPPLLLRPDHHHADAGARPGSGSKRHAAPLAAARARLRALPCRFSARTVEAQSSAGSAGGCGEAAGPYWLGQTFVIARRSDPEEGRSSASIVIGRPWRPCEAGALCLASGTALSSRPAAARAAPTPIVEIRPAADAAAAAAPPPPTCA